MNTFWQAIPTSQEAPGDSRGPDREPTQASRPEPFIVSLPADWKTGEVEVQAKGLPEPASLSAEFWQYFSPQDPVLDAPQVIEIRDTRLEDALQDLREVCQEAREEEYPEPTSVAVESAHRLLKAMFRLNPRRFEVYPTPDGEVALDAFGGTGRSVLVLCEADGGVLCLVNFNGEHRRARYASCKSLPDGFVREALRDL